MVRKVEYQVPYPIDSCQNLINVCEETTKELFSLRKEQVTGFSIIWAPGLLMAIGILFLGFKYVMINQFSKNKKANYFLMEIAGFFFGFIYSFFFLLFADFDMNFTRFYMGITWLFSCFFYYISAKITGYKTANIVIPIATFAMMLLYNNSGDKDFGTSTPLFIAGCSIFSVLLLVTIFLKYNDEEDKKLNEDPEFEGISLGGVDFIKMETDITKTIFVKICSIAFLVLSGLFFTETAKALSNLKDENSINVTVGFFVGIYLAIVPVLIITWLVTWSLRIPVFTVKSLKGVGENILTIVILGMINVLGMLGFVVCTLNFGLGFGSIPFLLSTPMNIFVSSLFDSRIRTKRNILISLVGIALIVAVVGVFLVNNTNYAKYLYDKEVSTV